MGRVLKNRRNVLGYRRDQRREHESASQRCRWKHGARKSHSNLHPFAAGAKPSDILQNGRYDRGRSAFQRDALMISMENFDRRQRRGPDARSKRREHHGRADHDA
jgi:hypothetical protein